MTYVIYHKNCFDGYGAAWVAHGFLTKLGVDAEYIPATYGDPVPEFAEGQHNVYILDFSYPRAVLEELATKHNIVVLDHHKTAQANCEGLGFCIFDMERSGAGLTWDYFSPNRPRPPLVNYIEDRDLWRFKLPKSKEIHALVASYEKTFENFTVLNFILESEVGRGQAAQEGGAILRAENQKIEEMCRDVRFVELGGHSVPAVNCPYSFGSNVGHRLLELFPDAPFAAYYFDRGDGEQQWGLRSEDHRVDVSEVAKQYGGGGHRNASGFVKGKVTR